MATERSLLVPSINLEVPGIEDRTPDRHRRLHYAINASTSSIDGVFVESPNNIPMRSRAVTAESASSGYDPFTSSMTDSPEDVQELLRNLEKATALVKRHVTMEQEEQPQRKKKALIPYWLTSYLLVITFLWQSTNLGVLEVIFRLSPHNTTLDTDLNLASNIVMTVFQFVHLMLVFFISVKLVKQVVHRSASGSLLAQSYLSTVLLFAGLYTLQYRLDFGHGWVIGTGSTAFIEEPLQLFLRMFYLSVSTATLCGTSQVEPIVWYSSLTISIQMLSSFVYFASILSLGVVDRKRSKYGPPPGRLRSLTSKIRRCFFKEDDE
ncbi:uncharacterized protein LOC135332854 [Halichondria panicea]|uniref:uncharacterized protein LOC135332854 n=1 Tax=Halichondria panicea TaxID=6063 RepID=UPI00312BC602